jgi:hypothetical protein
VSQPGKLVCESARSVSLPVTCQDACVAQPDRQSAICQACHGHFGATNIEDSTSLVFCYQSVGFMSTGDPNSCPPEYELKVHKREIF